MTTAPIINITGDTLAVRFDRFDAPAYDLFLKVKRLPEYRLRFDPLTDAYDITAPSRFAPMLGLPIPVPEQVGVPIWSKLHDDQVAIVEMSLQAKRFACWSDCGLGKTFVEAEFARQIIHRTGGRVLLVTLNDIVPQWIEMVRGFYGDALEVVRVESREHMKEWCATGCIDGKPTSAKLAVTNYEKFNHDNADEQVVSELRCLAGFILDESSRLKGGGGKQKWAIIKSSRGIVFKLSCTATPAPNEYMEFASQASFLERMRSESLTDAAQQIIWTYFTRDPKTHRWTIKRHARAAFFEWMASWSIYVRDPRKYGWRLGLERPPEPTYLHHYLRMTEEQRSFLLDFNAKAPPPAGDRSGTPQMFAAEVNATSGSKLSQAAKGFVYFKRKSSGRGVRPIESLKPAFIADLVAGELRAGLQVLIWTVFDEEAQILQQALRSHPKLLKRAESDFALLNGKTSAVDRLAILEDFRHGKSPVLLARADMLGYGMNFQFCRSMIFSGWTFSYEQFYQAVRRAFRDGQTHSVRVHIPIVPELEGQMYDAIGRKQQQHESAITEMEANYIRAMQELRQTQRERAA